MNDEPLYRIRSLRFSYGSVVVLDIPSLDIPNGRIISLLGPNGSGKTTLLKLIAGLLPIGSGSIEPGDSSAPGPRSGRSSGAEDASGAVTARARRRAVYVHQNPLMLGGTVYDNVAYGLKLRRVPQKEIAPRVERSLSSVGLADFARRRARKLSGGESQRVAIARALVLEPDVLLLDEPTASVDRDSVGLIRSLLLKTNREKRIPVIVSSHDLPFTADISDEVLFLSAGRVTGRADGGSLPSFISSRNGE